MDNITNDDMVEALGNLTVVQLIALTKELEEKWGLKAEPMVVQQSVQTQQTTPEVAQTEFDVTFVSYQPDKKMALVKLVRELLGLGLLESKSLVESVPKKIKEAVSKDEAEALKVKLTEAGAVVEVT